MKPLQKLSLALIVAVLSVGCEKTEFVTEEKTEPPVLSSSDVAQLLSSLPVEAGQMREVRDAVAESTENGYDEEYTMGDLFASPGTGVGGPLEKSVTKAPRKEYDKPLRELIAEHLLSSAQEETPSLKTKAPATPEEYLSALQNSGYQIYWPYHENWDGSALPIVTFDPGDNSSSNIGYRMVLGTDGSRIVDTVTVTEEVARETPVWVVNSNCDAPFTSLEMLRRQDPDWGKGGGQILVGGDTLGGGGSSSTKAIISSRHKLRTLILKEFTAKRNYDSWFAGASEFFVRCGSLENFTATTEEEMRNYVPSITDFMIVVRRNQVGKPIPFNAVLVSEWSDQLLNCAFMITEDDGGTRTSWKCGGEVKVKSKTYGFDLEIPLNTRDDIVWRGKLSHDYIERYSDITGHFGDVYLSFRIVTL